MKIKQPPARARRAAINEAIDDSIRKQREECAASEPKKESPRHYRGVKIEDWERLEARVVQDRALGILQSHPWYCLCAGCQSFAPRAVQSRFFGEKYDPLAT